MGDYLPPLNDCEVLVAVCERILDGFGAFGSAWEAEHPRGDGVALYRELQEAVEKVKRGAAPPYSPDPNLIGQHERDPRG